MSRRVLVTGLGCLSGLAQGVDATWRRICNGDDAARPFQRTCSVPNATIDGVAIWIDAADSTAFGTALQRPSPRADGPVLRLRRARSL